jgi:DNA sulfur modification protein DndC
MALDIKFIESEIEDQYLNDENPRPWIVGFSGGKDSTMLLQAVWNTIIKIPAQLRTRKVYVVCNDTLVENPRIVKFIHETLDKIQKAAAEKGLPITVHQTTPKLEDTFWVNLIGKGYPTPNNSLRWCTDRLKIDPTTQFIKAKISEVGEAIILLGTRSDESASRARSIEKNKSQIRGERLRKHVLPNAFVFAPIKDVETDELWTYLLQVNPPWGGTHRDLITLYRNASGGDCPLVIDTTTQSCGKSRFGCWVCTVVQRDKSMEALVDNGEEWMESLVVFRDMLHDNRNNREWRQTWRRKQTEEDADPDNWGPYNPWGRAHILKQLLQTQKEVQEEDPNLVLINYQELVAVQVTWHRDSIFDFSVAEIYNSVYHTNIKNEEFSDKDVFEKDLLRDICETKDDYALIEELLEIQKSKILLVNNYGIHTDLENHIERNNRKRKTAC